MNEIDDELRRALRRVDASEGFAERVRRRVEQPSGSERRRLTDWAIAATLVIAVAGGTWYRAEGQRRAQGEEAKRQVLLSLTIASKKLRAIEMKVNHGEDR
jgi:hypothetical protein